MSKSRRLRCCVKTVMKVVGVSRVMFIRRHSSLLISLISVGQFLLPPAGFSWPGRSRSGQCGELLYKVHPSPPLSQKSLKFTQRSQQLPLARNEGSVHLHPLHDDGHHLHQACRRGQACRGPRRHRSSGQAPAAA